MINNDHFYKSEMLILSILQNKDYTVDELSEMFGSIDIFQIKTGSLLTSLFFFIESHLVTQYEKENHFYYHIESAGLVRLDTLKRRYIETKEAIEDILKYEKTIIPK